MIQLDKVNKSFGSLTALREVTMQVEDGHIFGLVGTNGAGKSTLLRILAGIYRADSGQVLYVGAPVYENIPVKQEIFYISDDPYYFLNASIDEMKSYYRNLYPRFDQALYTKLLSGLDLDPNRKLHTFSKGMLRQAIIVLAFASRSHYILFDETFDGLDPVMRQAVKRLIASGVAENELVPVIASHNLRELEDIADHVSVLHRGSMVLDMRLDDMRADIYKIQCAFSEVPTPQWFQDLDVIQMEVRGRFATLVVRAPKAEILAAVQAREPVFMETIPLTLEEIFIAQMEGIGYEAKHILL